MLGCGQSNIINKKPLFTLVAEDKSNISFENELTSSKEFNIYRYRNFYNGGGVGIGDVNNDGLMDVYLIANMKSNRLFLNKGNWEFEDISEKAGVGGTKPWSTGVSMADVNGDGWVDIYVCNSGDIKGNNKQNELFINNKDGTFSEQAELVGLADSGYSTHGVFFDFDRDSDLDMYLLNNSYRSINSFNHKQNERNRRDLKGGDKLFRNDNNNFVDISEQAGIYGSEIGFGLAVSVSDLNKDGWPDLYVSNDFFEKDYLYMNNGNGTFSEEVEVHIKSTSLTSMGSDIADITGDGYPEIFVTDMLPFKDDRFKTTMTFENWHTYQRNLDNDYYHQFTRNTLQLNLGEIRDKGIIFSEIGRMLGIEATDWSWTALFADLDNNGFKDLYITNGIYKDILDQDYIQFIANEEVARMVITEEGVDYKQLVDIIPSNRIANHAYASFEDLQFVDQANIWGLDAPSHSSGGVYVDLDNDGDLDIIVNNVNMPLFVYKNHSESQSSKYHYLKVILKGEQNNTIGIGAQVAIMSEGKIFYQEQFPNRGFQSSVDPRLNFGLGEMGIIDSLTVKWPSGKVSVMTNIKTDQAITVNEKDALLPVENLAIEIKNQPIFQEVNQNFGIDFIHLENDFVDFDQDRLIYHMKSTEGPKICLADVDENGFEDLFIGGAKDSPGMLFYQNKNGSFYKKPEKSFQNDRIAEDVDNIFFDADGDGDQDLYVVSGGNEFSSSSYLLVDRLYFNDGSGNFIRSEQPLPEIIPQTSSCVATSDFDGDGDLDLFVGVRLKNRSYGVPQSSYLLENNGQGKFIDVKNDKAPGLGDIGLVTDCLWSDYDNDGDEDLWIVGEWMQIKLFKNNSGVFREISTEVGLLHTNGWWNTIESADINKDGYPDYILGNHGLNSRFKASDDHPIMCIINDFDNNGVIEQIVCRTEENKHYPLALRHDLVMQLPYLKKNFLKYEDYKGKSVADIFTEEELINSIYQYAYMLESVILLSDKNEKYMIQKLPMEAQVSPVYAVAIEDFDQDGELDVVTGGNLYNTKPEVGRYDASYGTFMKGVGDGNFTVVPIQKSGLELSGQIRDLKVVEINGQQILCVARNSDSMQFFKWAINGQND